MSHADMNNCSGFNEAAAAFSWNSPKKAINPYLDPAEVAPVSALSNLITLYAADNEQEQLRRDRIEQHRRRLYPDYYAREDAQKTAAEVPPPPAKKKGTPTALPKPPPAAVVPAKPPVAEPPSVPAPVAKPKPVAQPKPVVKPAPVVPSPKPKVVEAPAVDLKTAKPISYFDEAEDAPKPASTSTKIPSPGAVRPDATECVPPIHQASPLPGGTGSVPSAPTKVLQPPPKKQPSARTEVLNVGTKDGEAIPWLIELPEGGEK